MRKNKNDRDLETMPGLKTVRVLGWQRAHLGEVPPLGQEGLLQQRSASSEGLGQEAPERLCVWLL